MGWDRGLNTEPCKIGVVSAFWDILWGVVALSKVDIIVKAPNQPL
jgi:hypothetical protein